MNVSACLVTRGDLDMQPVIDSLPSSWEIVIWDNSGKILMRPGSDDGDPRAMQRLWGVTAADLSVYGRYAAIEYATHDLIYVQDDDVIVSDPQAIVDAFPKVYDGITDQMRWPRPEDLAIRSPVVANMPQEFRHDGYTDSCLVGFGAYFHRDAPKRAWDRMYPSGFTKTDPWFNRTCDVVFTTLTPRALVDIPKTDREMASDSNRMWKQPGHLDERTRMLNLVRQVRDA